VINRHADLIERDSERIGQAVREAVARAIDNVHDVNVVVLNVTVQYVSGGGAKIVNGNEERP
jgi:flavin-binding protein dodecin